MSFEGKPRMCLLSYIFLLEIWNPINLICSVVTWLKRQHCAVSGGVYVKLKQQMLRQEPTPIAVHILKFGWTNQGLEAPNPAGLPVCSACGIHESWANHESNLILHTPLPHLLCPLHSWITACKSVFHLMKSQSSLDYFSSYSGHHSHSSYLSVCSSILQYLRHVNLWLRGGSRQVRDRKILTVSVVFN